MSTEVLTLCPSCRDLLQDGFRVTRISVKTSTSKHQTCDHCRKKYSSTVLEQFTVTAKRK